MKKINIPKLKIPKLNISLRAFITIMTTILCGTIMFCYGIASNKMYYNKYEEEMLDDIRLQCEMLAHNLTEGQFKIDEKSGLDLSIDYIAGLFDGRIMIINDEYRIIKDSFSDCEHLFIVSEDVIRVMTGDAEEFVSIKDKVAQYIRPVYSDDEIKAVIVVNANMDTIDAKTSFKSTGNLTICVVGMVLCITGALLIGYASVIGIKRINRHIENTRMGHLDEDIPVRGFEEFRTLTNSYNNTMNKLAAIDSTRQEFVSNVSHELKTPITSMKVLADSLVQNDDADLKMYREFMTDIIEEIDRESEIINDLLTLVKTDRKDAEMNIKETDINNLLEVILKRVIPIAESRGIDITYESYRDVVAEADEVKLSLALTNIIENAVKYNVDNGWVKVTLNSDHKNFHIKVADSGVGIPDDCKEQVFERFFRVDKARSRDTGGTGLGLAITKNVIRMHKGTIKLYSETGEGTTFTIKIPIKHMEN